MEYASWNTHAVRLLLTAIREARTLEALDKKVKRVEVIWKEVAEVLERQGLQYTWSQVQNKWRKLKRMYRTKVLELVQSGASSSAKKWVYFDQIDSVIGERPRSKVLKNPDDGVDSFVVLEPVPDEMPECSNSTTAAGEGSSSPVAAGGTIFVDDGPRGVPETDSDKNIWDGGNDFAESSGNCSLELVDQAIDAFIKELLKEHRRGELELLREEAERDRQARSEDLNKIIHSMEHAVRSSTVLLVAAIRSQK